MSGAQPPSPPPRIDQFLGWKPDVPDIRDVMYADTRMKAEAKGTLPPAVDLRPGCPPIYDQGPLKSCTANALGAMLHFDLLRQGFPHATPSRLFIYYNERDIEGNTAADVGAAIRDGVKSVARNGFCREIMWPYDPGQFAAKPADACYEQALRFTACDYFRLQGANLVELKTCLAAGFPFVFGFMVYRSSIAAELNGGVFPMPTGADDSAVAGHAVMAVGYDDAKQLLTVRNSWGSARGDGGHYFLPYAYVENPNLAEDFWTIRSVVHVRPPG